MKPKSADHMLVDFKELPPDSRWNACLYALKTNYTLSTKDICKVLKCSRSWANKYIKNNVRHIYLSGYGGPVNYLMLASIHLGYNMTESVWYNTEEFNSLIRSSITSCTRQIISLPLEYLVQPKKRNSFRDEYRRYSRMIENAIEIGDLDLARNLSSTRSHKILDSMTPQALLLMEKHDISDDSSVLDLYSRDNCYHWIASPFKRTRVERIPLDLPSFDLSELAAVHDMQDYGDSSEEMYRRLFNCGCTRLEISIPNAAAAVSHKVYYLFPSDEEIRCLRDRSGLSFRNDVSVGSFLVPYADYIDIF